MRLFPHLFAYHDEVIPGCISPELFESHELNEIFLLVDL